jgi:acyl-CoA dehydrogenase
MRGQRPFHIQNDILFAEPFIAHKTDRAEAAAGKSAPCEETGDALMRDVFREDHELFRVQVRRYVEREIVPNHAQWERDGVVPKEAWRRAGANGMLCVSIPTEYGGGGGDFGHSAVVIEELARANATAPGFTTHSEIVAHYLLAYGSDEQKQKWLPQMAAGELIAVIAMTEPGAGSDLRSMKTSARRDGHNYVINGQKTFISNGENAGLAVTALKMDPAQKDLTLVCVETNRPGFQKGSRLEKIGLKGQDTSELFYSDVRVPIENRLGEEGRGFSYLTHQLAWERLIIAIRAAASIEALLEETIAYTRQRVAFGKPLFEQQNTRFKLADAKARCQMLRVFVDHCLALVIQGRLSADEAAMAKLLGSEMQGQILDELLQLHGGYGFMSEYKISRAWVDARVARIYGGTSEIMKEIIARSL